MMKKIGLILLVAILLMGCKEESPVVGEFEAAEVVGKDPGSRSTSSYIKVDIDGNIVNLVVSQRVCKMLEEGTKIDGTYNRNMELVGLWISGTKKLEARAE